MKTSLHPRATSRADHALSTFSDYADFLRGLSPLQRKYLLQRERKVQAELQEAVRCLATGLSFVGRIHDESVQTVSLVSSSVTC